MGQPIVRLSGWSIGGYYPGGLTPGPVSQGQGGKAMRCRPVSRAAGGHGRLSEQHAPYLAKAKQSPCP